MTPNPSMILVVRLTLARLLRQEASIRESMQANHKLPAWVAETDGLHAVANVLTNGGKMHRSVMQLRDQAIAICQDYRVSVEETDLVLQAIFRD
jgi:hypothetical protein